MLVAAAVAVAAIVVAVVLCVVLVLTWAAGILVETEPSLVVLGRGMYVIDVVGKLADPVESLRVLTAFKYYGSAVQNGIDLLAFAGLTLVGAVVAAAGAWLFERRDVL